MSYTKRYLEKIQEQEVPDSIYDAEYLDYLYQESIMFRGDEKPFTSQKNEKVKTENEKVG